MANPNAFSSLRLETTDAGNEDFSGFDVDRSISQVLCSLSAEGEPP